TRRRPNTSDRELTGMIATARAPVPADMARLAAAGVARNDAASIGSSGCGVESSANVASPAANSPSRTRTGLDGTAAVGTVAGDTAAGDTAAGDTAPAARLALARARARAVSAR